MVYSTSKPTVASQIEKEGLILAPKKVEVSDPSEITAETLRSASVDVKIGGFQKELPVGGGQVKSSSAPKVSHEHPVYALMHQGPSGPKKKIVMPPSGAYGGY